jgi:uncharacterized protein
MAGEDLDRVRIDGRGLEWDRWLAVVDEDGRFASGKDSRRFRRRETVFRYAAAADPAGVTVSRDGRAWAAGGADLDRHLSEVMGEAVRVLPEAGVSHQDDSPVSLVGTASLRWCADRFGDTPDPRRLRVNIVVETDEPFVEEAWVGRTVAIGSARLRILGGAPRCRMLDIDQDGVEPRHPWLRPLAQERDMELAVYADVAQPGEVRLGDMLLPD